MQQDKNSYWEQLKNSIITLTEGLRLTLSHFKKSTKQVPPQSIQDNNYFEKYNEGLVTVQYPHEMIPVPDNGRYRLHNEMDDCIVCDKCAKICPVDCIEIEPVKSTEVFGHTSDGTPKRIYAAKFDIDMAKCCFCGLCTTVCPTECLTMTKTFDFSEYDVLDHTYEFANMNQEQIKEKKEIWEAFEKEKAKPASSLPEASTEVRKPVFKPKVNPKRHL